MQNATVGELEISRLGIGTVQFGIDYGIRNQTGQVPLKEIIAILHRARRAGVNFLDTSRFYGESEHRIGLALRELDATQEFVTATKLDLPQGYQELSDRKLLEAARNSLYTSLQELNLSTIPIYLLHQYGYKTLRHGLIWNWLQEEQEKRTVGHVGVSIGNGPEEAIEALSDPRVEVLQIPFNILDSRWHLHGVFDQARDRGVALFGRSAYLQGLTLMAPEQVQAQLPFAHPYIARIHDLAAELDLDVKTLVLGYAISEPGLFSTVLGVDSVDQFVDNLSLSERAFAAVTDRLGVETEGSRPRLEVLRRFADVPERVVDPGQWNKPYRGRQDKPRVSERNS